MSIIEVNNVKPIPIIITIFQVTRPDGCSIVQNCILMCADQKHFGNYFTWLLKVFLFGVKLSNNILTL
jgi:hypothetical protein